MPNPRSPASLAPSSAFTIAEARHAGLSSSTLRSMVWDARYRGVRLLPDHGDRQRIAALLRALPHAAFCCGATAAFLHGLPLPLPLEHQAREVPTVGVPRDHTRIRRPGVVGRRLDVDASDVVDVLGIRCTSPVRTWAELAASLSIGQLTAVTDALLARRRPLATRAELEAMHLRLLGGRGSANRRLALDLASERAESPRESQLRVLLVMAGLPEPECNVEIFDDGRFVARVDLFYRQARLIIEYDGDHHRAARQWSNDQRRRAELESLGYRFTVVTARDFDDPTALIARIRRLLSARAAT